MDTTDPRISALPGTREFFPEEMLLRNWLISIWHKASRKFACKEYDAPVLEPALLYTRKGGDDILNEMFSFDDGGQLVALRPEMTPTLCRMAIKALPSSILPLKWYSVPQCWRNETVQRGRKREFYQWNVDIVGGEPYKADLEVLCIVVDSLKAIGLTSEDVVLKISNRVFLQTILNKIGVGDDNFARACTIIDKFEKISADDAKAMLRDELQLDDKHYDTLASIISSKSIEEVEALIGTSDVITETKNLFKLAEEAGIKEWIAFAPSVVRGLSYYTGMVFEGFCKLPEIRRALCGGGRYDDLISQFGYKEKTPCVGFGMGDVVILDILKEVGRLPKLASGIDDVVSYYDESLFPVAVRVARILREKGRTVDLYLRTGDRMRTVFDYCNRVGAERAILVAPDEWKEEKVVVKNLRVEEGAEKQVVVSINDLK